MKLIHCGDIHLDSRMESNLSAEKARERNAEICATFTRMIRYGMDQGVRAVLIAGDLFDTARASSQTVQFVLDRIRNAEGMDFLYLRGNHDEGDPFEGMDLPENLKFFGPEWNYYRYDDLAIAGVEPENWESFYDELKLNPEDTNFVMLHGQVSAQTGQELICLPKLRNCHIRYLALGHIHSYQKDQLDLDGQWCYCGCLEGRGFDELGQKGFVLLDVEQGRVKAEFVPFGTRTMEANFSVFRRDASGVSFASSAARSALISSSLPKNASPSTYWLK